MKDKERQIKIKRGELAELLNQEIEELQKAKTIEEMAKDFKSYLPCAWYNDKCVNGEVYSMAKHAYEDNYRKLPENSIIINRSRTKGKSDGIVVLLREELNDIENKCFDIGFDKGAEIGRSNASKETAEKIIHDLDVKISNYAMILDLPELPEKIRLIPTEVMEHFSKTLKEQFGVEIKE